MRSKDGRTLKNQKGVETLLLSFESFHEPCVKLLYQKMKNIIEV